MIFWLAEKWEIDIITPIDLAKLRDNVRTTNQRIKEGEVVARKFAEESKEMLIKGEKILEEAKELTRKNEQRTAELDAKEKELTDQINQIEAYITKRKSTDENG